MAHLFHGTHEQNYVYTVMMYALCLEEYSSEAHCEPRRQKREVDTENIVAENQPISNVLIGAFIFSALLNITMIIKHFL